VVSTRHSQHERRIPCHLLDHGDLLAALVGLGILKVVALFN
jgi:hypothetical protein